MSLRWRVSLANSALSMLSPKLLPFLYERNSAAATQGTLDGVPVVSDMPAITAEAKSLGAFSWDKEQTGCKMVVYQGVTGNADIRLKDGTLSIQKIDPKEGGAVDITFDFAVSDLDAETMGELAVLKNHEVDIELTAPDIISQQQDLAKDEELTPEKVFIGSEKTPLEAKVKVKRPVKPAGKVHLVSPNRGKAKA